MSNQTPEQLAKAAHDSKEIVFHPYQTGTSSAEIYVNTLLDLMTKEGKKK